MIIQERQDRILFGIDNVLFFYYMSIIPYISKLIESIR